MANKAKTAEKTGTTRKPVKNLQLDKWAADLVREDNPVKDDDDLLDTREVAMWLRVSYQWMVQARLSGHGPKIVNQGGNRVLYRRGDVRAWIKSRTFSSTSEYR
jgi:predicted DNA-binding transcriptional regulator AlpA